MSFAVGESERTALALARTPGVGPVTFRRLVEQFGSPETVFRSRPSVLRAQGGCAAQVADAISEFDGWREVDAELTRLAKIGGHLLVCGAGNYPLHLRRIHDPPPILYVLGDIPAMERRVLAIVGSRRCTPYGADVAQRLARDLAACGFVVVSGMARGIDAAAHRGALKAAGGTIAVLGCGVDVTYPPEVRSLKEAIRNHGGVLSELALGAPPDAHHFPSRNRIISGMSVGVLIVEATAESGSLITARLALEQGREVFAVPGNIGTPTSVGPNRLLKAGATLVESVDDLLEQIDGQIRGAETRRSVASRLAAELTAEESRVAELLSWDPVPVDELVVRSSLSPGRLAEVLLGLELKGAARQLPGNSYVRQDQIS